MLFKVQFHFLVLSYSSCSTLKSGDDGVDVWIVAVGLNYTADGGRRFRSLATIEWSCNPLVVTKASRDQFAAHDIEASLPEQLMDDMFITPVAESLKAPDPNRAPARPVDPVVAQLTQAIQSRLLAVTVNTPTKEDLWLAVLARKLYLPTSPHFNFQDERAHRVTAHVSPPSICERVSGCSLNWAHHKAPLKFQATRAITRAYFSMVGDLKQGDVSEKGSSQDIAKQLRDDIKIYSDNLQSLGLADHFIALDVDGFVFFLLALTRFIWLCFTGNQSARKCHCNWSCIRLMRLATLRPFCHRRTCLVRCDLVCTWLNSNIPHLCRHDFIIALH